VSRGQSSNGGRTKEAVAVANLDARTTHSFLYRLVTLKVATPLRLIATQTMDDYDYATEPTELVETYGSSATSSQVSKA
jgi:hypothetical protein